MLKLIKKFRAQESGFSLLELLLVVGVGALLLLAGIATYRLVTQGNNVNDAIRTLATVKQQTQRAFQGQRSYGAVGTDLVPTLVAMQAFPAGVLDDTNTPRHPWGDEIQIVGDNQQFTITFVNVPSDACIQLGTTFDQDDTDFISLVAGGTTFDAANPLAVTALSAAGACGSGTNVSMVWTFF